MVADLAEHAGRDAHPLLAERTGDRILLVVMTSDRGLAGGFNAQINRKVSSLLEGEWKDKDVQLRIVGRKGNDYARRRFAEKIVDFTPLEPEVLSLLARYNWPGNVRELENVLERALVLSGGEITPEHLPEHVRSSTSPFRIASDGDDLSVKRRLPALERELIARALGRTEGNRTRAAELLELSARALSYKIQEYELD